MNFKYFFSYFILLFLISCVGTVQQADTPSSLQIPSEVITFNYTGLTTARAIANDKIEVEFMPSTGNPEEISYSLYVNDSTTPVNLDPQSILTTVGGRLLYTVEGLQTNTEYKLKLRAKNLKTGAQSDNEQTFFTRTFDNRVANFRGITGLQLVPGQAQNSIVATWVPSLMTGLFEASTFDPVYYEVTSISQVGGPENLNNPNYQGTDRRVTLVPTPPMRATPLSNPSNLTISNLTPGTKYYVQVRALHRLYYDNLLTNPTLYPKEINSRFFSVTTETPTGLSDFKVNSVILSNINNVDGFTGFNVFWQPGIGTYTGYRIFARRYDGVADPAIDDKLNEATLVSMNTNGSYVAATTLETSKKITGLIANSFYQVKIALCKIPSCPLEASNPDAGILSNLKVIKTFPNLAPFTGINSIESPTSFSLIDQLRLRFDAPVLSSGFATNLEFYCVNPSDFTQMVKFNGATPISGSPVSRCNGLYLSGSAPSLELFTSQTVRGTFIDGASQYCFAATPAIIGYGPEVRTETNKRIVRCIVPQIQAPTTSQFPGVKQNCSVSGTTANVKWNLPTAGIYSNFIVFYKEKVSGTNFDFTQGILNNASYLKSPNLASSVVEYNITNLTPGKTYQVGVLTIADQTAPNPDYYSEFNINIKDCAVPLPTATFKGFHRIFAIGPKIDGRYPNDPATKTFPANSRIYEALNASGIPYETAMENTTTISNQPGVTNFTNPPGRDFGTNFNAEFDGEPESVTKVMASKSGIISLAWEEVDLSTGLTTFQANQPAAPASRTGRRYGYRILRSSDNQLTWQDLTKTYGLIYSQTFSYRVRSNVTPVSKRMAFFTDYSVKDLQSVHDENSGQDIERARVYYYKIIPVFDNQAVNYTNPSASLVKVSLPPANMALVHRWMANRARCLEIGKTPDINSNYSCDYNGIGSVPKISPAIVGQTKLDQNADLLVDRFEVSCQYTRGDRVSDPSVGASVFELGSAKRDSSNDMNHFPLFKGYAASDSESNAIPFKGCTGAYVRSRGATGTADDYPANFTAEYSKLLQGDCIGDHFDDIPFINEVPYSFPANCSAQAYSEGSYNRIQINLPGTPNSSVVVSPYVCSNVDETNPQNYLDRYFTIWASNIVAQSEFLAVFYNNRVAPGDQIDRGSIVMGPVAGSLTAYESKSTPSQLYSSDDSSTCFVNLSYLSYASINPNEFMMPRWISINEFNKKLKFNNVTNQNLLTKKISELIDVRSDGTSFYNGNFGDGSNANFTLPPSNLRSSHRFRESSLLGRVMTSNSSKLPPLTRLSPLSANSICSTYAVQTGFGTDSGYFSPTEQKKSKRLLRRSEFLTAAIWPNTYSSSTITSLELSNSIGNCNTGVRNNAGSTVIKGNILNNNISMYSKPNTGTADAPLVTGSSPFNVLASQPESSHSANCMSQFGIQDLVGNVEEYNSERLFCDFSQDSIMIGTVDPTYVEGSNMVNKGDGGLELAIGDDFDSPYILKSGVPKNINHPSTLEVRYRSDPNIKNTDARPWVKIGADNGYCSYVDNDSRNRTDVNNAVIFRSVNGLWNNIFLPGGNLNTNLVRKAQVSDQESVLTFRNGDGRFLDFGTLSLGPYFGYSNTLSLNNTNITATEYSAKSKYFNPIVGFPIICNGTSCEDPLLAGVTNDNTSISTTSFATNLTVNDVTPLITDYPIGGSQIYNIGTSEFNYFSYTRTVENDAAPGASFGILAYILVDSPEDPSNPQLVYLNYPQDFQAGTELIFTRLSWRTSRITEFNSVSGSGSNNSRAGRFSASFIDARSSNSGTSRSNTGFRCGTLINEE